jgi:hypothetical protein
MSYARTAIATATIVISLSAAVPGTQPAAASGGLAGQLPPQDWASLHRPALQALESSDDPIEVVAEFTTSIHAETQEQNDTAEWALEQMAAAGFELPPLTIHMHSDRADCSSDPNRVLNGYFVQIDGENVVHSCGNGWTMLHELTHVWDKNVLDDATRDKIIAHQGLESWNHETWNQAGGEHLASIVAWAIEATHPTRIGYYDRDHLAETYFLATGEQPPSQRKAPSSVQSESTATAVVTASSTATQLPG